MTIPQPPEMGSKVVVRLQNLWDYGPHKVEYVVDCGYQLLVDHFFYC